MTPGAHTFRVRAVDAAGLPGPASTRSFTVAARQEATPAPTATAQPTPTATAQPTPTATPTPEYKQDVVVAPVSGTVEICDKPGVKCRRLAAGAAIPMGSTVDTRKGVVELTSIAAAGAPPQTARFYDGMFKVTQSGSTTDLTLNEPLSCKNERQARERLGQEEAREAQAMGRRQGQVPHQGPVQRRDRPRARSGSCRTPARAR